VHCTHCFLFYKCPGLCHEKKGEIETETEGICDWYTAHSHIFVCFIVPLFLQNFPCMFSECVWVLAIWAAAPDEPSALPYSHMQNGG